MHSPPAAASRGASQLCVAHWTVLVVLEPLANADRVIQVLARQRRHVLTILKFHSTDGTPGQSSSRSQVVF
jgi:hypothetical protein